jgi:hypothetical protein
VGVRRRLVPKWSGGRVDWPSIRFRVNVSLESLDKVIHHGEFNRLSWSGTKIESQTEESMELGRRSKNRTEVMAGHLGRRVEKDGQVAGELNRCVVAARFG